MHFFIRVVGGEAAEDHAVLIPPVWNLTCNDMIAEPGGEPLKEFKPFRPFVILHCSKG